MTYRDAGSSSTEEERKEHKTRFSAIQMVALSEDDGVGLKEKVETSIHEL